jgi:hypothetical protein
MATKKCTCPDFMTDLSEDMFGRRITFTDVECPIHGNQKREPEEDYDDENS